MLGWFFYNHPILLQAIFLMSTHGIGAKWQDLEAYLTGATDTSDYIQLAPQEFVLPGLPSRKQVLLIYRTCSSMATSWAMASDSR